MAARKTPPPGCTTGNFVSEWFGHQVWPEVDDAVIAAQNQSACRCPFISIATGEPIQCVKVKDGEPYGVCTISSDSNGSRQNWIACPHRTLDQHFTLLSTAVRQAYDISDPEQLVLIPVAALNKPQIQGRVREAIDTGKRLFLFTGTKLGGEIDFPESEASPAASVDMSVIEVTELDGTGQPLVFGQHLLFEIQTSDFHGSPLHAVQELRSRCPTGVPTETYHAVLQSVPEVAGTGVEGPNKANIFKRTIYQMIFKIELARDAECAGFAIILPVPVWESWLRHLGGPKLEKVTEDGSRVKLTVPNALEAAPGMSARAVVYVFDIDDDSPESPSALKIVNEVEVSAASLTYHAFVCASNEALQRGVTDTYRRTFKDRARKGWEGKLAKETKKSK